MWHQPTIGKIYSLDEISGIQIKFKEESHYYLSIDFEEILDEKALPNKL
jgi:hypothetical protein